MGHAQRKEDFVAEKKRFNPATERRIEVALENLFGSIAEEKKDLDPISFRDFFAKAKTRPRVLRNIFNLFQDMVKESVQEEHNPNSRIPGFSTTYDYSNLFVEGVSKGPFFIGQMAAHYLMGKIKLLGVGQNKICMFRGLHGAGKSVMFDILMQKLEEYTHTDAGEFYRVVWRLDKKKLPWLKKSNVEGIFGDALGVNMAGNGLAQQKSIVTETSEYVQVRCPCNDHLVSLVPLGKTGEIRQSFLDDILPNNRFRYKTLGSSAYEWIFRVKPCALCNTLMDTLLDLFEFNEVLDFIYAERFLFNRRLGEGINIFGPGDKVGRGDIVDKFAENRLSSLPGSQKIVTTYSWRARYNNAILGFMDVKRNNVERLRSAHNEISDGVRNVGPGIEENVNTFFLATMNPEDEEAVNLASMKDRIEYVDIGYVTDYRVEQKIYENVFGKNVLKSWFLPRVLENFAKAIVASRIELKSSTIFDLIDLKKYKDLGGIFFLLTLLKLEIYSGIIPEWLNDEDRQTLEKYQERIIQEGEVEGKKGFSGRDSQNILSRLLRTAKEKERMIGMGDLTWFFKKLSTYVTGLNGKAEKGKILSFVGPLEGVYGYEVLQQVKNSVCFVNEEQVRRDISNYIFALNFDLGAKVKCPYTGDEIEITEEFFDRVENKFLGENEILLSILYREEFQAAYSETLSQEIGLEGKSLAETKLFRRVYDMWIKQVLATALDKYADSDQFRQAVKDYDTPMFATHDEKIILVITRMIKKMISDYGYDSEEAKHIVLYVLDKGLNQRFRQD